MSFLFCYHCTISSNLKNFLQFNYSELFNKHAANLVLFKKIFLPTCLIRTYTFIYFQGKFLPTRLLEYRGSPTSTVSTSTISTSTIFIAIGIKSVLVEFSRFCYVVKFVLVEIDYVVPTSTNFTSTIFPRSQVLEVLHIFVSV